MRLSHLVITAALATSSMAVTVPAFAGSTNKSNSSNYEEKNEKTVELKDIPAAARATAEREAKGGKLVKVEEMTHKGATVYEAVIQKGKSEMGVVIAANGKVIDRHPETTEK